MWPYQSVTRQQLEEKKDLVERLLQKLGAVPTGLGQPHPVSSYGEGVAESILSRRVVYRYRGGLYRVDEVLFPEKPFLVIEWAGREEDVQRNGMEDTDPFPWDLGEEDLLAELRVVLDVGCPACGKRREEEG